LAEQRRGLLLLLPRPGPAGGGEFATQEDVVATLIAPTRDISW
jgi:hypothetical protein